MAAEVSKARIAAEAVQGGDAVFGIECKTIARGRNQPLAIRGVRSMTLLSISKPGCERSARVSIKSAMAKALGYSLRA